MVERVKICIRLNVGNRDEQKRKEFEEPDRSVVRAVDLARALCLNLDVSSYPCLNRLLFYKEC